MDDSTVTILIASIGAVGVVAAAGLPTYLQGRTLGKKNGRGTVVEMQEQVLDSITPKKGSATMVEIQEKILDGMVQLQARSARMETRLARHDEKLDTVNERLERLEERDDHEREIDILGRNDRVHRRQGEADHLDPAQSEE